MVAFFLIVGIRNLQKHHVEDHINRLAKFKAPFPKLTFWVGQTMEFVGCALMLINWHPAVGVILLIVFTVLASALLLRFWEVEGPMRDRHAERHAGQYRHRRRTVLLLQNVR